MQGFGGIAVAPEAFAQPIAYFGFSCGQRQIAVVGEKKTDAADELMVGQTDGEGMGLKQDMFDNFPAFCHAFVRQPAAHCAYLRILGLRVEHGSVSECPWAEDKAGGVQGFHCLLSG